MARFTAFYLLFTVVAGLLFYFTLTANSYPGADFVLASSLYFFIVNLAFHAGLLSASSGRPAVFVRYYMGATTVKLFLHLGILVFFALFRKSELMPFAVVFLLLYLFHTGYEVTAAFRKIRETP